MKANKIISAALVALAIEMAVITAAVVYLAVEGVSIEITGPEEDGCEELENCNE